MSPDIHLFLLVPNDSGSTWLQNIISLCSNCVSFKTSLDGAGVCRNSESYPRMKINKLFSENLELWSNPDNYDWNEIKSLWFREWGKCSNYSSALPKVYLEKTPMSVFTASQYVDNFENVRFIIMTRNPYAVAEGMRRTIPEEVSIERCARHWIMCARQQARNVSIYGDISLELTYEELVSAPVQVAEKIKGFLPELDDIDFTKSVVSHNIDGMQELTVTDFNQRHINNLTAEDVSIINRELEQHPELLQYFGYEMLNNDGI